MDTINTNKSAKDIMLTAPVPKETRTYKPVSHQELIDLTLESIYQSGFDLDKQHYTAAREGDVATGKYSIKNVKDNDMQLQIAWQNSYDKTTTLKFAIGTKIFICENGMVSGDHGHFARKHVGEIQTFAPAPITEYIKQSGEAFTKMQQDRETFRAHEISSQRRAELLGLMFAHDKFIQSTQLNIIQRELFKPTHDYGAPNTLWELYNYVTFAMKEIHPTLWMKNHVKCHEFFCNEAQLQHEKMVLDVQSQQAQQLSMWDTVDIINNQFDL